MPIETPAKIIAKHALFHSALLPKVKTATKATAAALLARLLKPQSLSPWRFVRKRHVK